MTGVDDVWSGLREAADAYKRARKRLLETSSADVVRLLSRELASPDNSARLLALQVLDELGEARRDWLVELFPQLARMLVGPQSLNFRVRAIILKIEPVRLHGLARAWAADFVQDGDNDWGAYWGLLSLLDAAQFDDVYELVLDAAEKSPDGEIRNAGLDWRRTREKRGRGF